MAMGSQRQSGVADRVTSWNARSIEALIYGNLLFVMGRAMRPEVGAKVGHPELGIQSWASIHGSSSS